MINSPLASLLQFVTLFFGSSSSESIITKIKHNLHDTYDFYSNFATSNICVGHHCVSACFNCGGHQGLDHCHEPHDQTLIVQNKATFQEEWIVTQVMVAAMKVVFLKTLHHKLTCGIDVSTVLANTINPQELQNRKDWIAKYCLFQ